MGSAGSSALEGQNGQGGEVSKFQQNAAEKGDINAQKWLGQQYYWGRGGFPQDQAQAANWFERAARAGDPEAMYNLGVFQLQGQGGMVADRAAALPYFQRAAELGFAPAQNGLGVYHMNDNGNGHKPNMTKAFEHFRAAASLGSADGHYNVAVFFREGTGVQKDYREAVQHFAAAALNDHPRALWELGQAYWNKNSWLARYAQDSHIEKENSALELEEIVGDDEDADKGASIVTDDPKAIYARMLVNASRFLIKERTGLDMILVKISASKGNKKTERSMKLPLHPSCKAAVYFLRKLAKMGPWSRTLRKGLDQYLQSNAIGSLVSYASASEMGYSIAQHNYAWLLERLADNAIMSPANASKVTNLLDTPLLRMVLEAGSANDQSSRYKSLLSVTQFASQLSLFKTETNQPGLASAELLKWLQSQEVRTHIRWRYLQAAKQGDLLSLLSSARSMMPTSETRISGNGILKSHPRLAIKLFHAAMSLGEHEATYELAKMSSHGVRSTTESPAPHHIVVVEKNFTNAKSLLEKCADSGSPSAYPALLMLQYTKTMAFMSPRIAKLIVMLEEGELSEDSILVCCALLLIFSLTLKLYLRLTTNLDDEHE